MENKKRRLVNQSVIRNVLLKGMMCKGSFDIPNQGEENLLMFYTLDDEGLLYGMTYEYDGTVRGKIENCEKIDIVMYDTIMMPDLTKPDGVTAGTQTVTFSGKPSLTDPGRKDELLKFILKKSDRIDTIMKDDMYDKAIIITIDIDDDSLDITLGESVPNEFAQKIMEKLKLSK